MKNNLYITHVTLNSGHVRQTYPSEVDRKLYFALQRILRDSQTPAGAALKDGYKLHTTLDRGEAIGTIYGADGNPILTTACSSRGDGELWRMMHETAGTALKTDPNQPPAGAYIADRIETGAMALRHLGAFRWTGDFARCFGWVVLAPEKIRR